MTRPSTLLLAALLSVLAPAAARAAGLRCGTRLVGDGDRPSEVRSKCGEPADKQLRTELVHVRVSDVEERVRVKTVEEWTYDFGPHRLVQTIVFEDGHLVDVRSGGYGG